MEPPRPPETTSIGQHGYIFHGNYSAVRAPTAIAVFQEFKTVCARPEGRRGAPVQRDRRLEEVALRFR